MFDHNTLSLCRRLLRGQRPGGERSPQAHGASLWHSPLPLCPLLCALERGQAPETLLPPTPNRQRKDGGVHHRKAEEKDRADPVIVNGLGSHSLGVVNGIGVNANGKEREGIRETWGFCDSMFTERRFHKQMTGLVCFRWIV